jgi:predicted esterase
MMRHGPQNGATAGIVLLHGRGGSATDILSLMDHAALPQIAAIAPEAPGSSWWPTSFLAPSAQMEPFVTRALAQVDQAIATLQSEGIPQGHIWLSGFSQGACLAAEAYARNGTGLAGLLAFSGGLIGTGDAKGEPTEALYGYSPKTFAYTGKREGRVWLSVHERDPHIPLARVRDTANSFIALGATVETRIHPGAGHGLMQDDLAALRHLLNR